MNNKRLNDLQCAVDTLKSISDYIINIIYEECREQNKAGTNPGNFQDPKVPAMLATLIGLEGARKNISDAIGNIENVIDNW